MIFTTQFLITAVLGAVVCWLFISKRKGSKNLPPGPWGGIPVLGHVLQLGALPHLKFWDWTQKYGNIFQFKMGSYRCVILSDPKLVREAFNDPNMSGRVDLETFHLLADGKHGIVASDGPEWVEQRRFTLRQLRDHGFGKSTMENLIHVEVKEYMDFLQKHEGKPVSVRRQFSLAVLNSLWIILTGKRYNHDDPRLVALFEQNAKVAEDSAKNAAFFIPTIAKRFPKTFGWDAILALLGDMRKICIEEIDHHFKTYSEDDTPRDFIDTYIREIKSTKDESSSFYKDFGQKSLTAVMTDFLSAGSDTTSNTMSWAVLYLSKSSHVQKKMQEELDSVIGRNRLPSLLDRPNVPYTEAVILETLRMSSIVPFGVFHRATQDIKFHGYDILKDDWISPNQYYLHFSEELWDKPKEFNPTRFLSEDGKSVKRPEAFMPFSYGKRACIGETLARDSLFLFITSMFQKYDIKLAPESENVCLDPLPGFLLAPHKYDIVVKERPEV